MKMKLGMVDESTQMLICLNFVQIKGKKRKP